MPQPATSLPSLSPYRWAPGVLRDELKYHPSPEARRALAASYRRDVEILRAYPELADAAPEYAAIAAHIEAAAEDAR